MRLSLLQCVGRCCSVLVVLFAAPVVVVVVAIIVAVVVVVNVGLVASVVVQVCRRCFVADAGVVKWLL